MSIHTKILSHAEVISLAGGYKTLADRLGIERETVRFWERRASIPASYWKQVHDAGITSFDNLGEAAAAKREHTAKQS